MSILEWIEQWYKSQTDGDWEHSYGVTIDTLDNPGWRIEIDLRDTGLDDLEIEYQFIEHSENDWYGYSIKDARYSGAGDPDKLTFLLNKFRELIEHHS